MSQIVEATTKPIPMLSQLSNGAQCEPSSAGQYIVGRSKPGKRVLDPYDVKNVYRSQNDIDRAIRRKDFTHAKTMHMDYTTKNIYWLCYEQEEEKIDPTEEVVEIE